jgi:predicted kinase
MVGLQGSGKSTWVARHLAGTHAVVSKDHWPRARHREARQRRVVAELLAGGASVVVDNTSPSPAERAGLLELAARAGVPCRAVFLDTPLEVCRQRNDARTGAARVPLVGLHSAAARLVPPTTAEGFAAVEVIDDEAPWPRPEARPERARDEEDGVLFQAAGPEDDRGRGTDVVAIPEGSRAQTFFRPGSLHQP